jgi:uncharacterized lipoprotein
MYRITSASRRCLPLVLLPMLAGCSWLDRAFPDKSQDYKTAEPTQSLEVPPDLTTTPTTDALVVPSGPATLSGYTSARESFGKQSGAAGDLIVDPDALSFQRDKDRAWLVVKGEPASVWPVADTKWGPRPADPGMESEMLKRMMIFMGVRPELAEQQLAAEEPREARAELIQQDSGQAMLVVRDDFDKAWRNVGIVLDRVGFAVEDRDRLQGLYYVRYNDPLGSDKDSGLLSKLAFWSSNEEQVENYQIKLSDDGADTRIMVLNEAGDPEQSITAVRILNLLYDELK